MINFHTYEQYPQYAKGGWVCVCNQYLENENNFDYIISEGKRLKNYYTNLKNYRPHLWNSEIMPPTVPVKVIIGNNCQAYNNEGQEINDKHYVPIFLRGYYYPDIKEEIQFVKRWELLDIEE